MKKYKILTIAPVLALLAAGCSSPVAMQSTEYDDMYYSSSDQTEYIEPEAPASQQAYRSEGQAAEESYAEGEVANPEYSDNDQGISNYSGDEYYDGRTYDPRDSWYRPNYSFVDPYWGSAYIPRYTPYSRYGYDPYYASAYAYDPFYYNDPFFPDAYYGSGLSISIGYNMGWGRYPFYSAWSPYRNFYNGYYGGYYNNSYAYNPYTYFDRPLIVGKARRLQYGPRDSRGTVVTEGRQQQRVNAGRPERGSVSGDRQGQRVGGEQNTQRQSRGQVISPSNNGTRQSLPSRPSRPTRQPAQQQQQYDRGQRQQQQPVRQRRESRSQDYTPQRSQPVQRETRSYESRPSRSNYQQQSSPSPSYEPSRSSQQQSSSPSPSNSGGGRPIRGHN